MEIPIPIIVLCLTSGVALQGWLLKSVADLKIQVAILAATVKTLAK